MRRLFFALLLTILPTAAFGFGADSQATTATNITGNAGSANILMATYAQNTDTSVTGQGAETVLYTVNLPALGSNSILKVTCLWTVTNSSNNKTLKVKLGGTAFSTTTITTNNTLQHVTIIRNRNSTSSQVAMANLSSTYGQTVNAVITGTEATASGSTLTVTGTLANTSETITLNSVFVEVMK